MNFAGHSGQQQRRPRSFRSGFGVIPRRDPATDAGLWALGARREKLFIFRLVELDDERFDHPPVTEDVILRHDLFVSDESSPQRSRHLLYASERREVVMGVKISLNQMKLLQPDFSFRLQGRENIES